MLPPSACSTALATAPGLSGDVLSELAHEERCKRLAALVELRRLYRNLIRAKLLLEAPSPLYTPPPSPEDILAAQQQHGSLGEHASATPSSSSPSAPLPAGAASAAGVEGDDGALAAERAAAAAASASAEEGERRLRAALEAVGEMALTADQVKVWTCGVCRCLHVLLG